MNTNQKSPNLTSVPNPTIATVCLTSLQHVGTSYIPDLYCKKLFSTQILIETGPTADTTCL